MAKKIQILGAGLSGMVAAIDLAKRDYEVTIIEGHSKIGGRGQFHPSTHATPIDGPAVWRYIGIDLSQHFRPAKSFRVSMEEDGYEMDGKDLFIVERGARESSLDTFLYQEAQKLGVKFEFSQLIKNHKDLPPGSIIASGLFPEMFHSLGIPAVHAYGCAVRMPMDKEPECVVRYASYISDYYYSSVTNGVFFSMFSQRSEVPKWKLDRCREFLKRRENLETPEWFFDSNWVPMGGPRNPRLFAEDKILAGTLAGFMDPMFFFGINGALVSGRTAARAVYEPEQARGDFKYYTRNFASNWRARKFGDLFPASFRVAAGKRFISLPESLRAKLLKPEKLSIPEVKDFNLFKVIRKL
ncbi:MAG: NAD(P)-binding protein [bacterium]|nr:NAD(P)-binding protein [bacterium]